MNFLEPDSLPPELKQEGRLQKLVPEQILFHYRDTAKYVFALQEGSIRLLRYTCEGNLVIFRIVKAGECFAQSALFMDAYQCNAVVEEPSTVISYPKNIVRQVLQKKPSLALNFLPILANKNKSLKNTIELRSIRSANDRILKYLFFCIPAGEDTIVFDRTYKDIAIELGLSAEVLYRSLAKLERSGNIIRQGKEIKLLISPT